MRDPIDGLMRLAFIVLAVACWPLTLIILYLKYINKSNKQKIEVEPEIWAVRSDGKPVVNPEHERVKKIGGVEWELFKKNELERREERAKEVLLEEAKGWERYGSGYPGDGEPG